MQKAFHILQLLGHDMKRIVHTSLDIRDVKNGVILSDSYRAMFYNVLYVTPFLTFHVGYMLWHIIDRINL